MVGIQDNNKVLIRQPKFTIVDSSSSGKRAKTRPQKVRSHQSESAYQSTSVVGHLVFSKIIQNQSLYEPLQYIISHLRRLSNGVATGYQDIQ